jgi:PhzF family phenazine biosynthesis protein
MKLKLFQIDAFAERVFSGNPAAVCPLEAWLPDAMLQAIAAENNLSETAFFLEASPHYALRWFTPTVEVPLCGHATLASGFLIMTRLEPARGSVSFDTQSGVLSVSRGGELFTLDFPSYPAQPVTAPAPGFAQRLAAALGCEPREIWQANQYLVLLESEAAVRSLKPDFSNFEWLGGKDVIVTAAGTSGEYDFVSRFFAPNHGIAEDPVTGSTHCTLVPFWAKRLGKSRLVARQVSPRGGELIGELTGGRGEPRVLISGRCVLYLEGEIDVPV